MPNIIVTAFEPFNGRNTNISLEVLKNLKTNAMKKVLPVSWHRARIELSMLFGIGPDVIILCGEAGGREKIALEEKAVNMMDAKIPDNDGVIMTKQKIYDSIDELSSNIDCLDIASKVNEKIGKDAVYVSSDAGKYLCNMIYYHTLSIVYGNTFSTKVVFVHLPVSDKEEDIKINYPKVLDLIIEEIKNKYAIS